MLILLVPRNVFSAINLTISDISPKDDHYQLTAVVSGMSSSSGTFVQGMFTPKDQSKYFGYTFSKKGEWIKYESTPEKNFVLDNYQELQNDQPVTIFLKPDFTDNDYQGPGKYSIKLKRFTLSGTPSDYSNSLEVDLNYAISTPQPTPTSTPTPTPTPNPTTKTVTSTITPTSSPKTPTSAPTPKIITTLPASIPTRGTAVLSPASQAGQVLSTTSSEIYLATNSTQSANDFSYDLNFATASAQTVSDKTLFVIGASIFSLSGSLLYFRLKNL